MYIVCFDMESVLTPEVWIEFSKVSGIPELKRTTRDEPDYDKLMKWRLAILKERGLGIKEVQDVISHIEPLEGAREFLDKVRGKAQAVILSDTFEEFAKPLVEKLGMPTILCNSLEIAPDGEILSHKMRVSHSKLSAVNAFKSINYDIIAVGDSYNDLEMLKAAKKGFLFNSTKELIEANPDLDAYDDFDGLYEAIVSTLENG